MHAHYRNGRTPGCETMREAAERYQRLFDVPLVQRMSDLLAKHPNVVAPNFLSWEGEWYTGADTSERLHAWVLALSATSDTVDSTP